MTPVRINIFDIGFSATMIKTGVAKKKTCNDENMAMEMYEDSASASFTFLVL